ncbi:MAG: hypothetical protein LLG00_10560 [Planctomycetaceae bacterium]|nr:hypothetical protein [Planctomycetaceae bacterium]
MYAAQPQSWDIERTSDDVLLVRVHSFNRQGRKLPDAVFTFRKGEPQYDYWKRQLLARTPARSPS